MLDDNDVLGRLDAVEFVVTQCLAISLIPVPDKDYIVAESKKLFLARVNRLPPATVPFALAVADRIFSAALRSAKQTVGQA